MLKIILFFSLFFSTPGLATDLVIKVVPLNNRFASDIQPLISPFLEDSERIIATRSNLIIKATPFRQKEIKKLIDQLDTRLNNLTISVIQSNTETAESLNASANIRINIPRNGHAPLSTRFRGRFANTDELNQSDSHQKIQTLDGKEAFIKTGGIHPVENTSIHHSDYGYSTISKNTQLIESSTGFRVLPRITGNQVTLDISPWSDNMTNNGQLSTQSGHTTIRVDFGQWVEIGGVDEQRHHSSYGSLSRHHSTKNKQMKVLIKVEKNR